MALTDKLKNIGDAIREKTGKSDLIPLDNMPDEIRSISGGGSPDPPNDGKTRLYIHIPKNAIDGNEPPRSQVPIYIRQSISNGVTIDWGDGSATETLDGEGYVNTNHTYQTGGDFVISLDPTDGCTLGFGSANLWTIMGSDNGFGQAYCNMLKNVVIGKNVKTIRTYTFKNCRSISTITISEGTTKIQERAFLNCYSLLDILLPESITTLGEYMFALCYTLSKVNIPDNVVSIPNGAFNSCSSLLSIVIPSNVSKIGSMAFNNCTGMKEYHILSQTPPTLSNINAFSGISSDCIIFVPQGSLEAYQSATNWSQFSSHMQEEPA